MASTYSTNLKIELIATGEQAGTWGTTTNDNFRYALEQAIVGTATVTFASADVTLTFSQSNASQDARALRLNLTGTSGGARNLILGSGCQVQKLYIINNGLADTVTVQNTTGSGIAVPAGKTMFVYNNATDIVDVTTHLSSLTLGSALAVSSGGTGASTLTSNNVILGNGTSAVQFVAPGSSGNLLTSNGTTWQSTAPSINLATQATGTLPVANGGTGLATLTANNLLLGNGTSAPTFISPSTSGNILQADGTTWASSPKIVLSTAQATTSGVEKEFTSIPSWVKRITMMFDAVSTNGSSILLVQLGSTTYQTSGYDSEVGVTYLTTVGSAGITSGFYLADSDPSYSLSGAITISLMGSNKWVATSTVRNFGSRTLYQAGRVALSGTLDRIKLLTANGTDAFDAGSINIMYE